MLASQWESKLSTKGTIRRMCYIFRHLNRLSWRILTISWNFAETICLGRARECLMRPKSQYLRRGLKHSKQRYLCNFSLYKFGLPPLPTKLKAFRGKHRFWRVGAFVAWRRDVNRIDDKLYLKQGVYRSSARAYGIFQHNRPFREFLRMLLGS